MTAVEKKPRPDSRKPILLYLAPDLILELKKRALLEEKFTYQLAEEILSGKGKPVRLN